jgi:hypothetical protein
MTIGPIALVFLINVPLALFIFAQPLHVLARNVTRKIFNPFFEAMARRVP